MVCTKANEYLIANEEMITTGKFLLTVSPIVDAIDFFLSATHRMYNVFGLIKPIVFDDEIYIGAYRCVSAFLGTIFIIGGFCFVVSGRLYLNGFWQAHIYAPIDINIPPDLVTEGIYEYCRHPIYFGQIFMFIGMTLLMNDFVTFVCAFFMIGQLLFRAKKEDAYFKQRAGELSKNGNTPPSEFVEKWKKYRKEVSGFSACPKSWGKPAWVELIYIIILSIFVFLADTDF
jgi:protein-S-isoprenylcysteine O-methyltransferase Ste14